MCKFWKREKCNHHFPELNNRRDLPGFFKSCLRPWVAAPLLLAVVFFFGFIYLTQTNVTATEGYQIKDLEKQLTLLQNDNKKLKIDYIQLQSMANIIDKSAKLNLVPAGKVEIISDGGSVMALK